MVRSFYNELDGNHWAEFLVITDEAHAAIELKKWKLSNAYDPIKMGPGGEWHAVKYP